MAIRDDTGAASTTRPASASAPAARPSARTTGRGSMTSRKSIPLVSSTACRTVASRKAEDPYRSSPASSRRNWIVLASRSFKPGHRSSIRIAMSRSANRTNSGRSTRK